MNWNQVADFNYIKGTSCKLAPALGKKMTGIKRAEIIALALIPALRSGN